MKKTQHSQEPTGRMWQDGRSVALSAVSVMSD